MDVVVNPFLEVIKRNPVEFALKFLSLLQKDDGKISGYTFRQLRADYNIDQLHHYQYLSKVISKKLPEFLKNSSFDQDEISNISSNFNSFSEFVDKLLKEICSKIYKYN